VGVERHRVDAGKSSSGANWPPARAQTGAAGSGARRAEESGSRPPPRIEAGGARHRRRASASSASVRCRCSMRPSPARCRPCRCSTTRAREQNYSDEALEAMSRLVEIKLRDFGVEAEVVAVQPGPVITRFELRPAAGRQGQPDQQSVQGSGPRAIRHQRACGGNHSRQVGHRPGDSEREARDRHAGRDHQVQAL
jgi:hypothetical protein